MSVPSPFTEGFFVRDTPNGDFMCQEVFSEFSNGFRGIKRGRWGAVGSACRTCGAGIRRALLTRREVDRLSTRLVYLLEGMGKVVNVLHVTRLANVVVVAAYALVPNSYYRIQPTAITAEGMSIRVRLGV